jgi:hypothetical protein
MMLLTFFVLSTPPATAVPPSAMINAAMATSIAGDGRRKTLFIERSSFWRDQFPHLVRKGSP